METGISECQFFDHIEHARVIPIVSGLNILDINIFYNLYITEKYILYEL